FYIETYAQWCTWAVCNALDDENGKDVYRDIFSKICETQLPEYSNFKHFIYHNAEVIHKVFLMENGKPYFNEFLKQSYGGKIKVCYSRLEVELTVLMGDWGFTEDKNYAKLFEGEFVENVYLA